ncbi:MAG: hypothetical protein B5766_04515 [Candidatus Lumbricidophila eiseniae]|uniref:SipW-cognate class signal peptide n=1 Tax=Candidatus Lumbricidiphila eiseniae TaxID=1969409 RepID=A0A2A6FS63_9MICO|nr:MAG: hypothetical protein B5766_04515 [Candidatus Lumbricidophila eiseniae]
MVTEFQLEETVTEYNVVPTGAALDDQIGQAPRSSRRRRKMFAFLAGGLVLGLGAVATLAAWNDSEYATGTFTTGAGIDLQGSTNGTTFSSETSSPGRTLNFQVNADRLTPGAVVYAPFALRLSATSAYQADITVSSSATGAIAPSLSYRVWSVNSFGCPATPPTGTPLVATRSVSETASVALTRLTAVSTPVNLCIAVEAASTLTTSQTGSVTWSFVATSGLAL